MFDVKEQVVSALNTIPNVDVQTELFETNISIPCITYSEYMNRETLTGDTIAYSEIGITITVWSNILDTVDTTSQLVDTKMRNLGFRRVASADNTLGNLYRKVMDYKCLARENWGN